MRITILIFPPELTLKNINVAHKTGRVLICSHYFGFLLQILQKPLCVSLFIVHYTPFWTKVGCRSLLVRRMLVRSFNAWETPLIFAPTAPPQRFPVCLLLVISYFCGFYLQDICCMLSKDLANGWIDLQFPLSCPLLLSKPPTSEGCEM